jgi:hypothetical protein
MFVQVAPNHSNLQAVFELRERGDVAAAIVRAGHEPSIIIQVFVRAGGSREESYGSM